MNVIGGIAFGCVCLGTATLCQGKTLVYVDRACSDSRSPYASWETAATSIADALVAAKELVTADDVEIRLKADIYAETGFTLDGPIAVIGDTGNPKDVEIVDDAGGACAFTLSHADALVKDVTISGGGRRVYKGRGGHINMSAGRVENCVVQDGTAGFRTNSYYDDGLGGNVYMTGGHLVCCQLINGKACSEYLANGDKAGEGLYVSGGTVESCLIRGNGTAAGNATGGGVFATGTATILNCTIVDNASGFGSGIYVGSESVRVVNTVLYGNGGTAESEFGTKNTGRFFHCASSVTNDACATWTMIGADDFVSYPSKDFALMPGSVLRDLGSRDEAWCPSVFSNLDLAGNDRVSGPEIDVGCYEVDQSKVTFGGNLSTYAAFEGSNVTFNASAVGGSGEYVFRWDFGNGVTRDTSEAAYVYSYPASGLFSVSLSASDDGGRTWSPSVALATKIVIAPDTMYVDSACVTPMFPYKTRASAAQSIRTALAALTNNVSNGSACLPGATVRICAGTHSESGISLVNGTSIIGDTGNPKDVEIVDNAGGVCAFTLSHADALVKDVTISGGGRRVYRGQGGHVNMSAGRVENCVIRDGVAGAWLNSSYDGGTGGNVHMTGGRLVRCQIMGGRVAVNYNPDGDKLGEGLYASGGTVESCLIRGNGTAAGNATGGGVFATGTATILNCTIVDNASGFGSGIYVGSESVRVVNTVLYGNGGTAESEFGTKNTGRFFHCASSVTNDACATWRIVGSNAFRNYAGAAEKIKNLRPAPISPESASLVNGGSTWTEYCEVYGGCSTIDLLGLSRCAGKIVDIGCMEGATSGFVMWVR